MNYVNMNSRWVFAIFATLCALLAFSATMLAQTISGTFTMGEVEFTYQYDSSMFPEEWRNGYTHETPDLELEYSRLESLANLVPTPLTFDSLGLTTGLVNNSTELNIDITPGLLQGVSSVGLETDGQSVSGLNVSSAPGFPLLEIQSGAPNAVPEPSVYSLLVFGLGALGIRCWKSKRFKCW